MTDPELRDLIHLAQARDAAANSPDPSTKTGACLVVPSPQGPVVFFGWNRFPEKIAATPERLNDRDTKYALVIHCEETAVFDAYQHGFDPAGATLYTWPFSSCSKCAVRMIEAGIARVVAPPLPPELEARWGFDCRRAADLYREAGVEVVVLTLPPA